VHGGHEKHELEMFVETVKQNMGGLAVMVRIYSARIPYKLPWIEAVIESGKGCLKE
jgi:hypothetical protein